MTQDFLAYRFPEKDIQYKSGTFRAIDSENVNYQGFIIGDFYKKQQYLFKEESESKLEKFYFHKLDEEPNVIDKKSYLDYGAMLLRLMPTLSIDKIVYARIKEVAFESKKITALFQALCNTYPAAFIYLASSKEFGTWLGASPEILLESHEQHGFTMALAGTKIKDDKHEWSQKEQHEQQYVTDFILEQLNKSGINDVETEGPYTSLAGNLEHLRTDLSFDLNKKPPLELANILHPTPAVCGVPRKDSLDLIASVELKDCGYDRSLYCGYIGTSSKHQTKLYVNLRCCQFMNEKAFLYVGGGYTIDSEPSKEWDETERKSETLTKIFDLL